MSSKYLERRLNKIEERLLFVEENINQRIILLNEQLEALNEKDRFGQVVEFITLLVTAFKLILLGSAVMLPWNAIRDFWVKTSMFGFIIKSSRRYQKAYEKTKARKEKEKEKEEKQKENKDKEILSRSVSFFSESETIFDDGSENEEKYNERLINEEKDK